MPQADGPCSAAKYEATPGSLTGQFARFSSREKITAITFSNWVNQIQQFEISGPVDTASGILELKSFVSQLKTDGGTAIYSALRKAFDLITADRGTEPDRYYSVVLLTDGENNEGMSFAAFNYYHENLPPEVRAIKIFPVLFGSANEREMEVLARNSAGHAFDGKNSLAQAFKSIRGYQ